MNDIEKVAVTNYIREVNQIFTDLYLEINRLNLISLIPIAEAQESFERLTIKYGLGQAKE